MELAKGFKTMLRCAFLVFLAGAAWQDARSRSIGLRLCLAAGAVGVTLRCGELAVLMRAGEMKGQAALLWLADLGAAAGVGLGLLAAAAATREAVVKGDGLFFFISGVYLGVGRNLLLQCAALFLSLPVSCVLLLWGWRSGRRAGTIRLPFLVFAAPAGIGVLLL